MCVLLQSYFSEHTIYLSFEQFHVLSKCSNKFVCLGKEMLFIRKLHLTLNMQTDSVRARVRLKLLLIFTSHNLVLDLENGGMGTPKCGFFSFILGNQLSYSYGSCLSDV